MRFLNTIAGSLDDISKTSRDARRPTPGRFAYRGGRAGDQKSGFSAAGISQSNMIWLAIPARFIFRPDAEN
jgi:hypothetical protein